MLVPPASTWSRLRHCEIPGQVPLRTRDSPAGRAGLSPVLQKKVYDSNRCLEIAVWFAEQSLLCVARPVALLFIFPEDFDGHHRDGPASPRALQELRQLQGVSDARRGAAFLCRLADSEHRRPLGFLSNMDTFCSQLYDGWPSLSFHGRIACLRRPLAQEMPRTTKLSRYVKHRPHILSCMSLCVHEQPLLTHLGVSRLVCTDFFNFLKARHAPVFSGRFPVSVDLPRKSLWYNELIWKPLWRGTHGCLSGFDTWYREQRAARSSFNDWEDKEMKIYQVIDKPSRRCFCLWRVGWTVFMTDSKFSVGFRRTLTCLFFPDLPDNSRCRMTLGWWRTACGMWLPR